MKSAYIIILAVVLCIMLTATGCTGTSSTTAPATPAATTTTVVPGTTTAVAAPENTSAAAVAGTTAAPAAVSFAGTWNTTWNSTGNKEYVTVMVLEQTGTAVKGSYDNADNGSGKGSVTGTALDNHFTGWWNETGTDGESAGPLELILSEDGKAFTGRWASESDSPNAINKSVLFWNGARV